MTIPTDYEHQTDTDRARAERASRELLARLRVAHPGLAPARPAAPVEPDPVPVSRLPEPVEITAAAAAPAPVPDYVNPVAIIIQATARHFRLDPEVIRIDGRRPAHVRARHIAFYLGRTMTMRSFPQLGMDFAGRDHLSSDPARRDQDRAAAQN